MTVLVRPMASADADRVLAIYQAGLDGGHASFETVAPTWAAFDASKLPGHRFVAVGQTGTVLGWVAVTWTQLVDLAPAERTAMTRLMLPGLSDPAQGAAWTERRAPGQPSGWEQLASLLRSVEGGSTGYDVIVDYGRLSTANAPEPLLAAADAVLLVLRPTLPSVRAAGVAAPGLVVPGGAPVGLVTVGEGAYGSKELALELRTPVVAAMPADPRTAEVLSNGGERQHGRLLRAATRVEAQVWRMVDTGRPTRTDQTRPDTIAADREANSVR